MNKSPHTQVLESNPNQDSLRYFSTRAKYTHFFISTWPHKHMKALFFEKIKHIAHEAFDENNKHIKGFDCRM